MMQNDTQSDTFDTHKFKRIKRQYRYVYALKQKDEELVGYQTRFKQQTYLFELVG